MRSSQRMTAEQSTLARRAISSVRNWSQSFQPRRRASSAAMAPPPQPYSRSMVMRRNIAIPDYSSLAVQNEPQKGPQALKRGGIFNDLMARVELVPFPFAAAYRELVYRDSAAGFAFFHQEDHGNHYQDAYAQQPEVVEIGEHGGLALNCAFDQSIGLLGGECGACSVRPHGLRSAPKHRLKSGVRSA